MQDRRNQPRRPRIAPLAVILVLFIFVSGVISIFSLLPEKAPSASYNPGTVQTPSDEAGQPPVTGDPDDDTTPTGDEPLRVVSTATVSTQGDLLMHLPVIETADKGNDTYDFASVFRYIKEYTESYDYAVANLETTLAGTKRAYSGYPNFNCPDGILPSAVAAGYDMLLTANNHCNDTQWAGISRTLEQTRAAGLKTLGTQLNDSEKKYEVVDINGIKVGMLCYTYATGESDDGRPALNGGSTVAQVGVVNFFRENNLQKFYTEVERRLKAMREEGAEITMLYIHWGVEYQTKENANQRTIAQKLCDLGVDVIVGGHPHVVQPVDLLESTTDPEHKTVCIYSLGNAVSNQRRALMNLKTGHTEDGVLFTVTFEKYSDGSVYVADADVLPTWVNMSTVNGQKEYNILPLDADKKDQWRTSFNLTASLYEEAVKSYDRTMQIVGDGLTEVQTWLAQEKTARDAQ